MLRHLYGTHLHYLYLDILKGISLKLNVELKIKQFVWRGVNLIMASFYTTTADTTSIKNRIHTLPLE